MASAYQHKLGDILGMALRGEVSPAEAQIMANARIDQIEAERPCDCVYCAEIGAPEFCRDWPGADQ